MTLTLPGIGHPPRPTKRAVQPPLRLAARRLPQVAPASALCCIERGRQLVVGLDARQRPCTQTKSHGRCQCPRGHAGLQVSDEWVPGQQLTRDAAPGRWRRRLLLLEAVQQGWASRAPNSSLLQPRTVAMATPGHPLLASCSGSSPAPARQGHRGLLGQAARTSLPQPEAFFSSWPYLSPFSCSSPTVGHPWSGRLLCTRRAGGQTTPWEGPPRPWSLAPPASAAPWQLFQEATLHRAVLSAFTCPVP